jgi:spermidine synthase
MRLNFEELDYQRTALGELILQRRNAVEADGREIYEVKLNEEYLMSTLFYEGEIALTNLGLGALTHAGWDVVVGGLGLGFTAAEVLKYNQVSRMVVVEALAPVIDWHQRRLVPNGAALTDDPRCVYHNADFFALARGNGFDPEKTGHRFDAILLDIDHTPDALLNPSHADLYSEAGLLRLQKFLKPGGVFALWSNEAPEQEFMDLLNRVFDQVEGHSVEFANPVQGNTAINGVYISHCSGI